MTLKFKRVLRKGSRGNDVALLQSWLNKHGFSCGKTDGNFGNKTASAVAKFQKSQKIKVDSVAGSQTYSAINNYQNWLQRAKNRVIDSINLVVRRQRSYGICLITNTTPTKAQYESLIRHIRERQANGDAAIVVHHSASAPNYTSPKIIYGWHKARGFSKGGYHAIIQPDGTIQNGDNFPLYLRRSNEVGAHAKGWNTKGKSGIWGHKELPGATACPGKTDMNYIRSLI